MRTRFLVVATAMAVVAPCLQAETASGVVTSLGCHNVDDTCWVTLSSYGASAYCNHTAQLRWDTSTSWGKRWYATFLAASLSGASASLLVSDTTCHAQGYPTFVYGTIAPP